MYMATSHVVTKTAGVWVLMLMLCSTTFASKPGYDAVTFDGRLACPYISTTGGTAYLHITLGTPRRSESKRVPMNISVVLDRSGSMGDQNKMRYAKSALHALIDQLRTDDILSVVIYDDDIEVLVPSARVHSKRELHRVIERVYPRGSTNLGGGMVEGFRQVEKYRNREYVNRVILISDGLANRGITDERELARIAARYRSQFISLTAVGVGLDYNENLMVDLSERGGGNYYFIESGHGLAAMLEKEFMTISNVFAQNVSIELTLGRGVQHVDVIGCTSSEKTGRVIIPVGDLYAGDRREFTVELNVPPGRGSLLVAHGVLHVDDERMRPIGVRPFEVRVQYSRDLALIEKNVDVETQARVDIALSTRRVDVAMQALDEGRKEDAIKELKEAHSMVSSSRAAQAAGPAGEAVREQQEKLKDYADELGKAENEGRAKKSIQYDNYKTQKSK